MSDVEAGSVRRSVSTAMVRENAFSRYVMGNVQPLTDWLQDKPFVLRFVVGCVRGYGQPIFLNNPISGTIIFAALLVQNQWMAINGMVGIVTSQVTALAMALSTNDIENGSICFQGLMTGLVITAKSAEESWYGYLVFPVMLYSSFSVLLTSALGNLLGQWTIPAFNLPFNIATFLFIAGTGPYNAHFAQASGVSPDMWEGHSLDWIEILKSIPRGIGQCYACDNVISGSLITFSMLVCSPIIFGHALLGSLLGIFTGMALAVPPSQIYAGEWGYNAMLSCSCIGGFFYVLTWRSHLLALFSAVFATAVCAGMVGMLTPLPVLAFPFCIASAMSLLMTSESKNLIRVPLSTITYPEEHRRKFKPSNVAVHDVIT
ncbi:LOW QUALITY PROTEIN: urea transporter 1-like [Saccoglossus kowalevskii]